MSFSPSNTIELPGLDAKVNQGLNLSLADSGPGHGCIRLYNKRFLLRHNI